MAHDEEIIKDFNKMPKMGVCGKDLSASYLWALGGLLVFHKRKRMIRWTRL